MLRFLEISKLLNPLDSWERISNSLLVRGLPKLFLPVIVVADSSSTNLYNNYMAEISATINMITTTKLLYNSSVTQYNLYLKKFPNVLILKIFNFSEKELYDPNLV